MTVLLWQVLFYYPCIVADYRRDSWYTARVHSLPLASENYDNSVEHTVFVPSVIRSKYG